MPGQRGHHRRRARGGVPDGGARPGRGVLLPLQVTTGQMTSITHHWCRRGHISLHKKILPLLKLPRSQGGSSHVNHLYDAETVEQSVSHY